MIKVCVASTSAVSEPRTAATTTTDFARFRNGAALRTHGTDSRLQGCWRLYVGVGQRHKGKSAITATERRCIYLSIQLTFAGLHAIEPHVINVFVAGTSTVLKPSTARSATTGSVGFLKCAAFRARHCASDRWGADRRGERLSGDELSLRHWPA